MQVRKFSECATQEPEEVTFEEIKAKYDGRHAFGMDNLLGSGCYLLGGWCYDFKSELRLFLYKQYGRWEEGYAPNKTALRKVVGGTITKIIDITDL